MANLSSTTTLVKDKGSTLIIRDQYNRAWPVRRDKGTKFSTGEYGFEDLGFSLDREFAIGWDEIGLNNQLFYYNAWGDLLYHGRVNVIEPSKDKKGRVSIAYQARGFRDAATATTLERYNWPGCDRDRFQPNV
jgi:hypothetical protein